jgi:hypothetical protein
LVDTELRRSLRIKAYNIGSKPVRCGRKNCLGYDLDPPPLSSKVIRKLGEKFCKVAPEELSDVALKASKTSKKAIKPPKKPEASMKKPQEGPSKAKSNGYKDKKEKKSTKK